MVASYIFKQTKTLIDMVASNIFKQTRTLIDKGSVFWFIL